MSEDEPEMVSLIEDDQKSKESDKLILCLINELHKS